MTYYSKSKKKICQTIYGIKLHIELAKNTCNLIFVGIYCGSRVEPLSSVVKETLSAELCVLVALGPLAQLVEHITFNDAVPGSSPGGVTNS